MKEPEQGCTLLRDWHPVIAQGLSRRRPPPCWVLIQKLHAKDREWLHEPPTVQTRGKRKETAWMEVLQSVGRLAALPGTPFTPAALAALANGRLVKKHRKSFTAGRKWVNGGSPGSSKEQFLFYFKYINTHIFAQAVSGVESLKINLKGKEMVMFVISELSQLIAALTKANIFWPLNLAISECPCLGCMITYINIHPTWTPVHI